MIYQNEYWYDIMPKHYSTTDLIAGKWLYFDDSQKLHALLGDLDRLVESGDIRAAKIARKLPGIDPFPEKPCVLCVFTSDDPDEKERVKRLLKSHFDISVAVWKSEEQTLHDWEEGGWLQIQAEITKIRRGIETGRVSDVQAAQKRMLKLTEQLESLMKDVDDPDRKAEIHLNVVHELRKRTEASLSERSSSPSVVLPRLVKLEKAMSAILSKMEEGEIGYQRVSDRPDPNYVFVIMPFAGRHIDTYDAIRRAVKKAAPQLRAERIDEKPGAIAITDEIHRSIHSAAMIICDLTEERPNVYYELGYTRGLDKPVICIARQGTTLHFDVYGLKTIFFETYRELEKHLSDEITKLLQHRRSQSQ